MVDPQSHTMSGEADEGGLSVCAGSTYTIFLMHLLESVPVSVSHVQTVNRQQAGSRGTLPSKQQLDD